MIKRTLMLFILTTVLVSILAVISGYTQEDVITVRDSAFQNLMRAPVVFFHDQHNEKAQIDECSLCHHVYDDDGLEKLEDVSSEGMECSECHQVKDSKDSISLIKRYHNRCKRCHLEAKAGPIMCSGCHARTK